MVCARASAAFPEHAAFHILGADIAMERGEPEQAAQALERAARLAPHELKLIVRLARLRAAQERWSEAARLFQTVQDLGGHDSDWLVDHGRVLTRLGDHAAAVRLLEQAVGGADAGHWAALMERARAGLAADRAAGVSAEYKRIHLDAVDRLRDGRPAEAEALFKWVTKACPAYAPAWIGLRGARQAQGRRLAARMTPWAQLIASPRRWRAVRAAAARPLSARGLLFDPREPLPIRRLDGLVRRVRSAAELKRPGDKFLLLDPGGDVRRTDALLGEDGDPARAKSFSYTTSRSFVVGLDNAAVVGRGAVVTRNGALAHELITFALGGAEADSFIDKHRGRREDDRFRFDAHHFLDGACDIRVFDRPAFLMAGPTDLSFGDWIDNFAPRLALAEAAALDWRILVSASTLPQYLDMLLALGVRRENILWHNPEGVSILPRLYVPSWPFADRMRPMADPFHIYRRVALDASPHDGAWIYLSRRDAAVRPMVNEDEVVELFLRRGFRIVDPARLSFREALELYARPACVAGPYGSAFRNFVFSSRPSLGLFIMPPVVLGKLDRMSIWMGGLGVKFVHVKGRPTTTEVQYSKASPWTVPLDRVNQAIDRIVEMVGVPPRG